jgi:hypothetical protein
MATIRASIYDVISSDRPMTVRQVFYQLVIRGVIPKKESEYKGTVCRLLAEMRRAGDIPYDWIADHTRWMRKPTTYSSLEAALRRTAETYRRAVWDDMHAYVEIWLEKEALAGVLYEVTAPWDVPLMVTRGYPSISFLYSAAEAIADKDCPTYIYYFGDYDPSGVDIPRFVHQSLNELLDEMDYDDDLTFKIEAVTPDLIDSLSLPTRPTKRTDARARNFVGESVEVDAIPAGALRDMTERCIDRHVDKYQLNHLQMVEKEERSLLTYLADVGIDGGASA